MQKLMQVATAIVVIFVFVFVVVNIELVLFKIILAEILKFWSLLLPLN